MNLRTNKIVLTIFCVLLFVNFSCENKDEEAGYRIIPKRAYIDKNIFSSLAITCNRCGVNVYDYFCDIIDRCAAWTPNTPIEKYRNLLPDRWKPSQK